MSAPGAYPTVWHEAMSVPNDDLESTASSPPNENSHEDSHESTNGVDTPGSPPNSSMLYLSATGEQAEVLRVLDRLRKLGLDEGPDGHSLPRIIVCGTQSSGKSSVLEAIAGIPFPRKNGICTRYKTRVTLQRTPGVDEKVVLKITPNPSRPAGELPAIKNFEIVLEGTHWRSRLGQAMQEADNMIFSGTTQRNTWTRDLLSITMSGPNEQDLELLDLPGLFSVETVQEGSVDLVKQMVEEEMQKPNSIVLAVVKATNDLNTHDILQMCKVPSVARRTLVVFTMPDRTNEEEAASCVKIIEGQHTRLEGSMGLDWHVLLNRDGRELTRNTSTIDRDNKELNFFETETPWNQVRVKDRGIQRLRKRLNVLLFTVVKEVLPKLFRELDERERILRAKMESLGEDLTNQELQTTFKSSTQRLREQVRDHARGYYDESDITEYDGSHIVHLRSRIVEQGEAFRDRLLHVGHTWDLKGRRPAIDPNEDLRSIYQYTPAPGERQSVDKIEHEEILKHIENLLNTMRDRGLPGFNNKGIVNKEFRRLSKPWKSIAEQHIDSVWYSCVQYFGVRAPVTFAKPEDSLSDEVEGFGNNDVAAERYRRTYLIPELKKRRDRARRELVNLEANKKDACQNLDKEFLVRLRDDRDGRALKRSNGIWNNQALNDTPPGGFGAADVARAANSHTQ
jgi:GTP-binding protein EngB required for normal cell division